MGDELEAFNAHDIGVVVMEVMRNFKPTDNFPSVRTYRSAGIILVFDECTTGFRETFGGLHKSMK